MKKILSILLMLSLLLSLCACGTTNSSQETPPEPQPGPPPMEVKDVKSESKNNFNNLKYSFTISIGDINLKIPATLNDYINADLTNVYGEFDYSQKFISNATASARLKTKNGEEIVVHLSNPSNLDVEVKDSIVSGITIDLNKESSEKNIKVYPSVTNATQKFITSKTTIEDAEIVLGLGEHCELKDFSTDHTKGSYIYGAGEQKYLVTFAYDEEQFVDKITINALSLLPQKALENVE